MKKREKPEEIVKHQVRDTYLAVIKNSVKARLWRNSYALINNKRIDIMKDGDLSCAFYVSSILKLFNLIDEVHATVSSTIKDLEKNSWQEIKKPSPGDVLIWQAIRGGDGSMHTHIGFYLRGEQAISNSSRARSPQKHHWTYNNKRDVTAIYHRKII